MNSKNVKAKTNTETVTLFFLTHAGLSQSYSPQTLLVTPV